MDRIKLTDAITGNENGIKRLKDQREEALRVMHDARRRSEVLEREITARENMLLMMQRLQAVVKQDKGEETIVFMVPDYT